MQVRKVESRFQIVIKAKIGHFSLNATKKTLP